MRFVSLASATFYSCLKKLSYIVSKLDFDSIFRTLNLAISVSADLPLLTFYKCAMEKGRKLNLHCRHDKYVALLMILFHVFN